MEKLSKRELQVLLELLKNARISDQEIARRLGTSRPGIAKIRKRLEQEELILGYSPILSFQKIGLSIQCLLLYNWIDYSKKKDLDGFKDFVKKMPEFVSFIEAKTASFKTNAIISIHNDLAETEEFIEKLKAQWKDNVDNVEILISTLEGVSKQYLLNNPVIKTIESHLKSKIIASKDG